jgi:Zn-dependent protease
MDLGITPELLRTGLLLYVLLVVTLCLRAYAQAWMAYRLGDTTAADNGRLTLNPLPHMDLIGSVFMPLLCIFYLQPRMASISFFLAWAKPVPVNPANFQNPNRDFLFTQLANPGMSLMLALLAAIVGGLLYRVDQRTAEVFVSLIFINASLIVIDCLPIPPLPGAMVLRQFGVISDELFWQIARWGGLVLIIAFQIPIVRGLLGMVIQILAYPFMIVFQLIAR